MYRKRQQHYFQIEHLDKDSQSDDNYDSDNLLFLLHQDKNCLKTISDA